MYECMIVVRRRCRSSELSDECSGTESMHSMHTRPAAGAGASAPNSCTNMPMIATSWPSTSWNAMSVLAW